eukprot:m51a1_g174 hypothetical protein (484) ;mRNA; f:578748-580739
MPPLYESTEMLRSMLLQLALMVVLRERNRFEKYDTGHAIIGGVEGTGKTTIVKALAVAVAACSPGFFLVYVDFEEKSTAACAAADAFCLEKLLVEAAARDDPRIGVVAFLEDFAKNCPGAMVVLTGSSANLRSRLFQSLRSPEYNTYSDFNKSLCRFFHVAALRLRDSESLAQYIQRRYGCATRPLDDEAMSDANDDFFLVVRLVLDHQQDAGSTSRLTEAIAKWRAHETCFLEPCDVSMPYHDCLQQLKDRGVADATGRKWMGGTIKLAKDGNLSFDPPIKDLSSFSSQSWHWRKETGIDCVQFTASSPGPIVPTQHFEVCIDAWQCKANRPDVKLGGGNPEKHRKTAIDDGNVSRVDDERSIFGITTKAEVGFCKLAAALLQQYPSCTVRLGTLVVCTTRSPAAAAKAQKDLEKKLQDSRLDALEFSVGFLRLSGKDAKSWRRRVHFSYAVRLICGDSWIRQCLEPQLRRRMPVKNCKDTN